MTPEEVVTLWRSEIADVATPSLWSDTEAYNYLDDAQTMFCRNTGGIPDSTSSITLLSFSAGDTTFKLDERILKVRDAYRVSDGRRIPLVNIEDMQKLGMRFDGKIGPLTTLIIGMDETEAHPYPVPVEDVEVQLVIDRLPLEEISESTPGTLEIPRIHHRHLMLHMNALAYLKQDAETFNKSKSSEFKALFEAYCFKAKLEKDRRKHKTRVVSYGGIPSVSSVSREDKDY